ncbi:MAG TPA: TetR/AcrR family transcriptional regulator [Gemmatimonadaceae bacterium]|nr:TetR/AcrR family transcriptional regulator [Gemmatimonadaceae bacterium]
MPNQTRPGRGHGRKKSAARAKPPAQVVAGGRDRDTEQRILDAARRIFVRRGTSGARMQEIAAEAGVNQALLHYYFRTKERLAQAIFLEAAGRLVPAVVELMGSDAPIERKVEEFVHLYIDTVRRTPFLPGYVLSELHQHPERLATLRSDPRVPDAGVPAKLLAQLRDQIDAGVSRGELRRIEPEQLVINLLALSVFPFVARPMLGAVFGMDDRAFERFLDARRRELPVFILSALRP